MLDRSGVPLQPLCHLRFGDIASCVAEEGQITFFASRGDGHAIEAQKTEADNQGGPFISIYEGVTAGDPESVGRCQTGSVFRAILAKRRECETKRPSLLRSKFHLQGEGT